MDLTDKFVAKGNDFESFEAAITDLTSNTGTITIRDCEIQLLSFKEKLADGTYTFHQINDETLNAFNSGHDTLPILSIKPKNIEEEIMFYEMSRSASGLLLLIGKYLLFISENGVPSLADRADIRGMQLQHYSLTRNLYIAEGLFSSFKRTKNKDRSTIIYRRQNLQSNKNAYLKKCFAVMGSRFYYTPLSFTKNVVQEILKLEPFGRCHVNEWALSHYGVNVHIDFTEMADSIQKKYNLPDRIIPGISIVDSDTGQSSFSIRFTYRVEGSKVNMIIDEKVRNHTAKLDLNADAMDWINELDSKDFEKITELLAEQLDKKFSNRKAAFSVYKNAEKALQLVGAIQKKNAKKLEEAFKIAFPESMEISAYDVSMAFLKGDTYLNLKDYALAKVARTCALAPYACEKNISCKAKGISGA